MIIRNFEQIYKSNSQNRNTETIYVKYGQKLTIKRQEDVTDIILVPLSVTFKQTSHIVLAFPLSSLNKQIPAWKKILFYLL